MRCMAFYRIPTLELAEDLYPMTDTEREDTMAQMVDQDTEGRSQQQELQETTQETNPEIDIDTEDIQTEVAAEKEEETMMMTGIGRPAMARADTERVARSP